MKEILVPMSSQNVLAILEDRKTMTRRMAAKYAKIKKGDILLIQEGLSNVLGFTYYKADGLIMEDEPWRWKVSYLPSIFMPKRFVRCRCVATADARQERLQEITEEDAIKEGIDHEIYKEGGYVEKGYYKAHFALLWDSLNGKTHPWESNPIVNVVEFRRLHD